MGGILVPKKTTEHPNVGFGVCVWRLPDGSFIKDEDGNYLCVQGPLNNLNLEIRMRGAARSWGAKGGTPVWFPGFRKITDNEWCDQMADFLDGKVPDAVDAYLQTENGG